MNFDGQNVTIMGLGRFGGGAAAARWAARRGAIVTVTDLATDTRLAGVLDTLAGERIARFHLGGHRAADFSAADIVVVNPAVKPGHPLVKIAADAGAWITSETELFLRSCPAPVVGVSGTNGKSTTAAMLASILQNDGRRTWLGGNLGGSLLDDLGPMRSDDQVVVELSSFQLHRLGRETPAPHVAVLTNCSPNHLNWHGRHAHYVAAKQQLLTRQSSQDMAVLNVACREVASWTSLARGRRLPLVDAAELPDLPVPGEHNRQNAILAATAARGVGCTREAIERGLADYRPLPGRLEQVATIDGRCFYNDTTATTPESTAAALDTLAALGTPTWLLAGGTDKGLDFQPLVEAVARRARGAALFGNVRHMLHESIRSVSSTSNLPVTVTKTMEDALGWCRRQSCPGDSILLSPACASHDQFDNFRHRGETFVALVEALARGK